MNSKLRMLRTHLLAMNLLSRQMMGRLDELTYYTIGEMDDDAKACVEYLYQFLEQDYERLKLVCQETRLPDKEQVIDGDSDSTDTE